MILHRSCRWMGQDKQTARQSPSPAPCWMEGRKTGLQGYGGVLESTQDSSSSGDAAAAKPRLFMKLSSHPLAGNTEKHGQPFGPPLAR